MPQHSSTIDHSLESSSSKPSNTQTGSTSPSKADPTQSIVVPDPNLSSDISSNNLPDSSTNDNKNAPLTSQSQPTSSEPGEQNQEQNSEKQLNSQSKNQTEPQTEQTTKNEDSGSEKNLNSPQSTTVPEIENSQWYYLDEKGQTQGPNSFESMSQWWSTGFFQPHMYIKRVEEENWSYIGWRYEFTTYLYQRDYVENYRKYLQQQQEYAAMYGGVGGQTLGSGPGYQPFSFSDQILAHHNQPPGNIKPDLPLVSTTSDEKRETDATHQTDGNPFNYVAVGSFNTRTGRWQSLSPDAHWGSRKLPTDAAGRQLSHYFDVEAYQEQKRKATGPQKQAKKKKKT